MSQFDSEVVRNLKRGKSLAWASLVPAYKTAIVLALEAEHEAERSSIRGMTHVSPSYPPLVSLLAASGVQLRSVKE